MESMVVDAELEPQIDMDEGDLDLEILESDVRQMAKKISEYRQTLPDHLSSTLHSALPSKRLTIPEPYMPVMLGTQEQDYSRQKLIQLKEKVSRNAANLPKLAKRVRECIERIDKLDSLNGTIIHPAFRIN